MDKTESNKNFPSTNSISVSNKGLHAAYRMTNLEKRALLCMTADLDSMDDKADIGIDAKGREYFLTREQSVKDFLKAMNLNPDRGDAVSALRKISEGLMSRYLDVNGIEGKRDKGFKLIHFLDRLEVTEETGNVNAGTRSSGGLVIRWQLSSYFVDLYKKLRGNFTRLQLSDAIQLRNEYSIRFFEYFTEAWNRCKAVPGETVQLEMTLDQIRYELDFDANTVGKRSKEKAIFRDAEGNFVFKEFNRSCLKPAINEIVKKGLFNVSVKKKYAKGTHTTIGLVFMLSKPVIEATEGINKVSSTEDICNELKSLGIDMRSAKALAKKYEYHYLKFGMDICLAKKENGSLKSFASYLYKAYSSEWLMNMWEEEKIRISKIDARNKAEAAQKNLEDLLAAGKAVRLDDGSIAELSQEEIERREKVDAALQKKYDSMSEEDRAKFFERVKQKLNPIQKRVAGKMTCDEMWNSNAFKSIMITCIDKENE